MSTTGPELPPHLLAKRKRQAQVNEASEATAHLATHPNSPPEKKKRVLGPAPPPAALDERPTQSASGSDSDSDDEWGPAPPPVDSDGVGRR